MGMQEDKNNSQKELIEKVKPSKVFLPVLIGLGVVAYMFSKEFSLESFEALSFTKFTVFWLLISLLFMVLRDVGYMIRIKILSEQQLTWKQAFRIIMLWEFTSAEYGYRHGNIIFR